jgi:hypothetical protein
MIVSKVYAADYSLRFPRVEAVRLDKDASCVNTDQELREQVLANQGTITAMKARMTAEGMLGAAEGAPPGLRRGRKGAGKKGQAGAQRGGVPLHLRPVDVSGEHTGLAVVLCQGMGVLLVCCTAVHTHGEDYPLLVLNMLYSLVFAVDYTPLHASNTPASAPVTAPPRPGVEVEVNLLQGAEVCILNYAPKGTPPQQARASKQQLYELVKKMGGVTTEVPRFSVSCLQQVLWP